MSRPRKFVEEDALDRALLLFWERGYEGTALSDLLAEMRITKSSLYQAFGNKEALFRRVQDRYDEKHLGFRHEALEKPTPRQIVEHLLDGMLGLHTGSETPPGCLITNAALACSPASESIRLQVAREREAFRLLLRDRLAAASAAGPLPNGLDSDAAASLVQTIVQGLAVQAKSGATRDELWRVVQAFLALWPET